MTYPGGGDPPPIIPPIPVQYPPNIVPPPKKRRAGLLAAAVVAVVLLLGGGVALATSLTHGGKPAAVASPTSTWTWSPPPPMQSPPAVAPDPKGFTIGVKVLRKACFGSAGCNITFRIDPAYTGAPFTRTTTWEVVYQVNGATDAYTNRFTLTGSQASYQSEEMVQTSSSSAVLTVVVTDVLLG